MSQVHKKSNYELNDVAEFIEKLGTADFFDNELEVFVTRAPGRLDVMGGIADYCGSLMLPMPIRQATKVALQKSERRQIEIVSENEGEILKFAMSIDDFFVDKQVIDYQTASEYFSQNTENHWASYICGVFFVLIREKNFEFKQGSKIYIVSDVPLGKGVSSSAALEVSVMQAVCAAFAIEIEPREKAILCQKVENLIVGAPCGVLDQMASMCGQANRLLALVCQPAELQGTRQIPDEIAIWGIDSGIRHSVGGGDYGSVRTGAFIGYRIITELAKLKVQTTEKPGFVKIEDGRWNGYLANLSPAEFEKEFAANVPQSILGGEFLERYQGITDSVTAVNSDKNYNVYYPTVHQIYENWRVHKFAEIMERRTSERDLNELGKLMYQAHESYSACGLGTDGTDLLVDLVKNSSDLFGAKITGGGSGGTVAILGKKGADAQVEKVAETYHKETGNQPFVFSGSSPGAADFGYLTLQKEKFKKWRF